MAPKKNYTPQQMANAIEAVQKGEKVAKAAENFGVPRVTLHNKVTGKSPLECSMGPGTYLSKDEEKILELWVIMMSEKHIPITKDELLDSVQRIITDKGQLTPFANNRPGKKWYSLFLKRHPIIAERTSQNLTTARDNVRQQDIERWFKEIEDYLQEKDLKSVLEEPDRIFNTDESAFYLSPNPGKVLTKRGEKHVYSSCGDEKDNLTVLITGNAAGTLAPPMVVYSYERIPAAVARKCPHNFGIGRSQTGWMCGPTFYEYITNVFHPWLVEKNIKKPILFFLDGHKSHLTLHLSEFCAENGIELIALYPNSTHLLQPMDLSVFRPLKLLWRKTVTKWKMNNLGQKLKKEDFAPLLQEALKNITEESIKNGFRAGGLHPFGASYVDMTKIKSGSRTTQNQESQLQFLNNLEKEIKNKFTAEKLQYFKELFYKPRNELNDLLHNEDTSLYLIWASIKHSVECYQIEENDQLNTHSVPEEDDERIDATNFSSIREREHDRLEEDDERIDATNFSSIREREHDRLEENDERTDATNFSSIREREHDRLEENDERTDATNFSSIREREHDRLEENDERTDATNFSSIREREHDLLEATILEQPCPSTSENGTSCLRAPERETVQLEAILVKQPRPSTSKETTCFPEETNALEIKPKDQPSIRVSKCLTENISVIKTQQLNSTIADRPRLDDSRIFETGSEHLQPMHLDQPNSITSKSATSMPEPEEDPLETILPRPNSSNKVRHNLQKTPIKFVETQTGTTKSPMKIKGYIVPSPFKRNLPWPEEDEMNKGKKRRFKEKLPFTVTSQPWREYHKKKEAEKQYALKEKERKAEERAQKKKLKEKLKQEKKKSNFKRITTDDTSSDDTETEIQYCESENSPYQTENEEEITSDVTEKKNKMSKTIKRPKVRSDKKSVTMKDSDSEFEDVPLSKLLKSKRLSKGTYVVVIYEGEYFPGLIENISNKTFEISTMTFSTGNTFKWPEKPDKIWYREKDIVDIIDPPVLTNKRGFYTIKEMTKYLPFTV